MRTRRWFGLLLIASMTTGCAYFNTFYNTKKYFKEALQEHEKRKGDKPTSVEKQKFDKTIKQASKVLQLYPDSKYVDDSLMILGESFFYVEEYLKAERKFQELLQYFPKSHYREEAQLWLAKTRVKLKKFSEAVTDLQEILSSVKNKSVRREAQYWLAEAYRAQENYEEAAKQYKIAVKKLKDEALKYAGYVHLGECFTLMGDHAAAAESFRLAVKHAKTPEKKFDADLAYGRALIAAEKYDDAVRILSSAIETYFNSRRIGLAKLELANALMKKGDVKGALEWYKSITEDHPRTAAASGAYLAMGKYQETHEFNYKAAAEYYQKARLQARRSEYAEEAVERSERVKRFLRIADGIRRTERQIDALKKRLQAAKTNGEAKKPAPKTAANKKSVPSTARKTKTMSPAQIQAQIDSLNLVIARKKVEMAEVYLFTFDKPDSAMNQYLDILSMTDDPQVRALAFYSLVYIFEEKLPKISLRDSLLQILAKKYPQTPQGQQAARLLGLPVKSPKTSPEEQHYQKAEGILFDTGRLDDAMVHLDWILKNSKDPDWRARALYLLGWAYEQKLGDNQKAYAQYKTLVEQYPRSPLVPMVRKKIFVYEQSLKKKSEPVDTVRVVTEGRGAAAKGGKKKVRFSDEVRSKAGARAGRVNPQLQKRRALLDDEEALDILKKKEKPAGGKLKKPARTAADSSKNKKKKLE